MWFLYIMSLAATLLQIAFVTVSIAAGLYYMAELVEEYTVVAKKCITWMVIISSSLYCGLAFVEDLPWFMITFGLLAQSCHAFILRGFPYVIPLSPAFIVAVMLLIVNHYLAFQYFGNTYFPFSEVLSYFTLCLWMVPFALFVSLSANDNVLPMTNESKPLLGDNDVLVNYFSRKDKKYGLLSLFSYIKDFVFPNHGKKAF
ncbi:protein TEX261 isoform X1 [Arctopsyche grandis]|uniref:protein TEX261 isoform X1 n=1 Tax=Arctopsyche grandis TaxID=121162 RepID=UPI00406D8AF4